ncbi:hypothetical protein K2P56_00140 [Patescibacteria group bacterium]|nr:hypothetical protein [Patescibacteria group bacterium]
MWAAIPLVSSIVLLAGFVAFRVWEEKRGRKFFASERAEADAIVSDLYRALVMGNIPQKYREMFLAFVHNATHMIVVLAVSTLRAIERPLSRFSYRLRQRAPGVIGKEPSAFLKTLTPEKKEISNSTETTN